MILASSMKVYEYYEYHLRHVYINTYQHYQTPKNTQIELPMRSSGTYQVIILLF